MGGDSVVSSQEEDSCLEEDFPNSPAILRDNLGLQDEDNWENGEAETGDENAQPSSRFDHEVDRRRRHNVYQEILQNYDELKNRCKNLKEAKEKILRYRPGAWVDKVGGLKSCDYDLPKTACLLLVGPRGSGKSSLINRISKVFEDDKFAPARAQVSYNSPNGDGTYFLQEYMIPRDSTSVCLYDTRSLSDYAHENENNRMLKSWMTKGVRHGELVVRNADNQRLRKSLKCKAHKNAFFSSKIRKVNFVIFVVNGLLVLKAMENTRALETEYTETIVSTFNNSFLSFKDDKPVLVFTHGDLLSLSDRVRVRAHLGELLGIPPTKQIFDIPDCDDPVTDSTIIEMLRYSLQHAERNYPQKNRVMDKVHKAFLSLWMVLLILGLAVAIALAHDKFTHPFHVPQHKAGSGEVHDSGPKLEGQAGSRKVHDSGPKLVGQAGSRKVHDSGPKLEGRAVNRKGHDSLKNQAGSRKVHKTGAKLKDPQKKQKIDWYKIRHIW